ncbi:MAG: hypothetical protein ACOH1P_12570 [Lysobacter sp.]
MEQESPRLPENFVASFEFVHPKDIAEALTEKRAPTPSTMWTLRNEVRPSDLYCYLGARFGPPNGLQNFFRSDDSDNLVHWEWYLKTSIGHITIAGLNFRTDVWIAGAKVPDSEKAEFLRQIKVDFSNYGKEMAHLRKEHLEPWIEFVNPYQRLRRAVKQLITELDELNLDPSSDALPSLLESQDMDAATKQWRDRAADYSRAIGLSFGIRAMVPVMAESFVNLLLFILARPSVRADKQLFDGIFRLPMHVRIRSLPYYCVGFKAPVDSQHQAVLDYLRLIDTRNDLLHGNIDVEKLKFNELYFLDKVPIFNQYSTMWERSLGVAHRAVGLEEVHAELAAVDAFVKYLLKLLQDNIAEEVKLMSEKFDLVFEGTLDDWECCLVKRS